METIEKSNAFLVLKWILKSNMHLNESNVDEDEEEKMASSANGKSGNEINLKKKKDSVHAQNKGNNNLWLCFIINLYILIIFHPYRY